MSDSKKELDLALNDALSQKFQTQMGQKVLVERHKIGQGERYDQLRQVLTDIGEDLKVTGDVPKGIELIGSFSVHAYYSPVLQQMFFATVNSPGKCSFNVAQAASAELFGALCETYGVRRQKKRSGL